MRNLIREMLFSDDEHFILNRKIISKQKSTDKVKIYLLFFGFIRFLILVLFFLFEMKYF